MASPLGGESPQLKPEIAMRRARVDAGKISPYRDPGDSPTLLERLIDGLTNAVIATYFDLDREAIERGMQACIDTDSIPSDATPMREIIRGWRDQRRSQ
jgi:hypothetical protein